MPLVECAVVSFVILATAIAMIVLFHYDPEATVRKPKAERHATEMAIKAELGHVGAFFTRISAYRSTRAAAATLAAMVFGVLEDATHEMVIRSQLHSTLKAMADGVIVAACGGALVWLILTALSRKRVDASAHERTLTSVKADVRLAIETIVQSNSSASAHDRQSVVRGVEQIEAAMMRLYPAMLESDRSDENNGHETLRANLAASGR